MRAARSTAHVDESLRASSARRLIHAASTWTPGAVAVFSYLDGLRFRAKKRAASSPA